MTESSASRLRPRKEGEGVRTGDRREGAEIFFSSFLNHFLFLFSCTHTHTHKKDLFLTPLPSPCWSQCGQKYSRGQTSRKHPIPTGASSNPLNIQDPYTNRGNLSLFGVWRSRARTTVPRGLLLPPSIDATWVKFPPYVLPSYLACWRTCL